MNDMFRKTGAYVGLILLMYGAIHMLYTLEYFFDFFHWADTRYMEAHSLSWKDLWLRKDIDFWLVKKDKVHDAVWSTALYVHVIGSLLAVLIGPIQFIPSFRNAYMNVHRMLGKTYVISILGLGVPTGFYMAMYANGGKWAIVSFTILSTLWLITTYIAYAKVRQKAIPSHKNWMIRSYAITFAAVTLRFWTATLSVDFEVEMDTTIVAAAWLAWIPNLLVAECIVWFSPFQKRKKTAL